MNETAPVLTVVPVEPDIPLQRGVSLSALFTLFTLTLRQHARGLRLVLLGLLFLLPALLAVLVRFTNPNVPAEHLEEVLILYLMPHVLVPLAALLYASGMIADEVEEQTLTYLLVRPLPRRAIYLTKLLASWLTVAVLVGAFTFVSYGAVSWGNADFARQSLPWRPLHMAGLFTLTLFGYCAGFGLLSLVVRRSLVVGIVYIAVFEGLLANIDFAFRQLTIVHYFRVLCARWLDLRPRAWQLNLTAAPTAENAVLILAAAGLLATVAGAFLFAGREFRVKTPEGS